MDHVQQILLQQLQGQTGGPVITQRPQRNTSHDSSNSEGSKDSVSELALKARQVGKFWSKFKRSETVNKSLISFNFSYITRISGISSKSTNKFTG